jgi:hypothetical protein
VIKKNKKNTMRVSLTSLQAKTYERITKRKKNPCHVVLVFHACLLKSPSKIQCFFVEKKDNEGTERGY